MEAESKLRDFERRHDKEQTDRVLRAEFRQLQDQMTLAKQAARTAEDRATEKEKSVTWAIVGPGTAGG